MNWLTKLFTVFSRTEKHADRIDAAVEGMADDLEEARKRMRERLGLDPIAPTPQLPSPAAVSAIRNGRRNRTETQA